MSIYDHINDPEKQEIKCTECNKDFTWSENGPFYPGGKDTEFINCPHCGANNGSIRTSGFVSTNKIQMILQLDTSL